MTVQVLTDPLGNPRWVRPATPGAVHAARTIRTHGAMTPCHSQARVPCWADKGRQGLSRRRRHRADSPLPLEQAVRRSAGPPTSPTSRSVRSVRPRSEPGCSCASCTATGGMTTSADIAAVRAPGRVGPSCCAPTKAAPRSPGKRPSPVRSGTAPRSPTPSPGVPRELRATASAPGTAAWHRRVTRRTCPGSAPRRGEISHLAGSRLPP